MNSYSWWKDTKEPRAHRLPEVRKTFFQPEEVPVIWSHEDTDVESNTAKDIFSFNKC